MEDYESTDFSNFETNTQHWKIAWSDKLRDMKEGMDDNGNAWGNPDDETAQTKKGDDLGNYKKIHSSYITPFIKKNSFVLDIGVGGGKWIPYFLNAKAIVCVDVVKESFDFIKYYYKDLLNLRFYKTNGFELMGIPSNFVDFIFSMDVLVRYPHQDIKNYFKEFNRVLKPNGKVCIHLPYKESVLGYKFKFIEYDMKQIEELRDILTKNDFEIDTDTINHGILIH